MLKVGAGSHAFYGFNSMVPPFLSTPSPELPENGLPGAGGVRGKCQTSSGRMQTARPDAPNGTVIADMCAAETTGTVNRGGEVMAMKKGQFLMNVMIEAWQWCGCDQQEGQFLEFNLTVLVPAGYKISKDNATGSNMPVKISLGTNDSFIMISSKVTT